MYYDAAVGVKGQKRISGSFAIRFDLGSSYCTQHLRPACRLEESAPSSGTLIGNG